MRSSLGSITERKKGVWLVRATVGKTREGKQRRVSKTVRGTRRDAERALQSLLAQTGQANGASMTLREYIEGSYLPWHWGEYPRRDAHAKLSGALGRACDQLGDMSLGKLTKPLMARFVQDNSTFTVDKLRAALNKAVEWELIPRNPMDGARKRVEPPKRRRLTAAQLRACLGAVAGDYCEPGFLLQAYTGMRQGEVLGLDWEGIDWENGLVRVDRTWHWAKGEGWFEGTKNRSSVRTLAIPDECLRRLAEIRDGRRGPLMVGQRSGERLSPNTYSGRWRALCQPVLGDDFVNVENLRHTHASILFDAGLSIEDVQTRLGHASFAITERYYVEPDGSGDARCADAFSDALRA